MDKIIKIIRSSKTPDDAKVSILKTKWKINKSQKLISLVEGKKGKNLYSLSEPQVLANFSLIFFNSSLITFKSSFFDEIIFLYLVINSASFLISTSISFIPNAVNF